MGRDLAEAHDVLGLALSGLSASCSGVLRRSGGMVVGMATKKITVTLPVDQFEQIRALVESGRAKTVSGFVQHSVGVALDDVAGWGAMLARALEETGGILSEQERTWADEALGSAKKRDSAA